MRWSEIQFRLHGPQHLRERLQEGVPLPSWVRRDLLLLLVLICTSAGILRAGETKLLSVDETVRLVQNGFIRMTISDPNGSKLNPAARPEIRKILEDGTQRKMWLAAFAALAHLGDDKDVPYIEQLLCQKGSQIDNVAVHFRIIGSTTMLRFMKHKQRNQASDLLERLLTPQFWHGVDLGNYWWLWGVPPADEKEDGAKELDAALFVLSHYTYWDDFPPKGDDFPQKAIEMMQHVKGKRWAEKKLAQIANAYHERSAKEWRRWGGLTERDSNNRAGESGPPPTP